MLEAIAEVNREHSRAGAPAAAPARPLSPAARGVLLTLIYYHAFRFPLRQAELRRLWPWAAGDDERFRSALATLSEAGLIQRAAEYVFLGDKEQIAERERGERRARAWAPRVAQRAALIASFPFVRAVALSGTYSKGILGPADDVDFFVVTAAGRVFLCRTLLMLFKKLLLLNSHRFFCVNYLIDERQLSIPDRNLFTATEIAWLRPAVGAAAYAAFAQANPWVRAFLPHWPGASLAGVSEVRRGPLARALESLLGGRSGDRLEARLRGLIARRNERRYAHLGADVRAVALRAEAHASKHHPRHYQGRVLERFERLVVEFEERHGLEPLRDVA